MTESEKGSIIEERIKANKNKSKPKWEQTDSSSSYVSSEDSRSRE
jgi:hypothetical protein